MRKLIRSAIPLALAGALVAWCPAVIHAQGMGGGGGGGMGGGGGGMGGGMGSSSSSAFGGGTSSSTSRSGSSSSSGTQSYGSTSFLGQYYSNPMAYGLSGSVGTSGGSMGSSGNSSSFGSTFGTSSSGSSGGMGGGSASSTGVPGPATAAVSFGQPLYGNLTSSSTNQGGTANIRPSTTGTTQPQGTTIRPAYVLELAPDFKPDRVPVGVAEANFMEAVRLSTDLSRPDNRFEFARDGDVLILRGVVEDARQRYLAETIASMTPGLRGVRNELRVRNTSTTQLSRR